MRIKTIAIAAVLLVTTPTLAQANEEPQDRRAEAEEERQERQAGRRERIIRLRIERLPDRPRSWDPEPESCPRDVKVLRYGRWGC